ncbi:MAG: L,D-transpeptidase [Halanaerobiales bacterium]
MITDLDGLTVYDRVLILQNPPLEGYDVFLLQERLKEFNFYNGLLDSIYDKPWSIGSAASHGCFHMYNRDIEELYEWVPIKTRVKELVRGCRLM